MAQQAPRNPHPSPTALDLMQRPNQKFVKAVACFGSRYLVVHGYLQFAKGPSDDLKLLQCCTMYIHVHCTCVDLV